MSQGQRSRYFDGWVPREDKETTAEQASTLRTHCRVWFDAEGRMESIEMYDGERLFRIDYEHRGDDDELRIVHSRRYPDVPFGIRRLTGEVAGFRWRRVDNYHVASQLARSSWVLLDSLEREWMDVTTSQDGAAMEVTKYYWETPDVLRYVFEYGRNGELLSVFDLSHNDHATVSEVLKDLSDSNFYSSAGSLPATLAGTTPPYSLSGD